MKDKIIWWFEKYFCWPIIKIIYRKSHPLYPYYSGIYILKTFIIWQKIFRLNGSVPWPVHPSSSVSNWKKIKLKGKCDLQSPGCYFQAGNGIEIGENVIIGPNVGIISANHSKKNFDEWIKTTPIKIGNNVSIGMNSVILPGVNIGSNVTIGAGTTVSKDIPNSSLVIGNYINIIKK